MALHDIIVIGASAGGAEALRQILRDLPADFSATIFVVTHLPSGVRSVLPRLLSAASRLLIAEAAHGASVEKGRIYVAPSGAHLLIGPDGTRLGHGPCVGMAVAFAGLATIGLTVGGDLTPIALGLALAGAFSWAVGNVLVKRHAEMPIFPLVVWCSLVPPLPSLLICSVYDSRSLAAAVSGASWLSLAATLYPAQNNPQAVCRAANLAVNWIISFPDGPSKDSCFLAPGFLGRFGTDPFANRFSCAFSRFSSPRCRAPP